MPQIYKITETSPLLHDANCVYCHVDLALNDLVVVCDECRSPHHQECWRGNGGHCATFGCTGSGVEDPLSNSVIADDSVDELSSTQQLSSHSARPTPDFARPSRLSKLKKHSALFVILLYLVLGILFAVSFSLIILSGLIKSPSLRLLGGQVYILFGILFLLTILILRMSDKR